MAAFQTRNVPHRGHEFLQHEALKVADGLFIQPVIGEKKIADFKDEYIISSYKLLVDNGYYGDRAVLGILPLKMRYAGPREAVMHAVIRKNYGCSHFIVGRDHAGVGSFYPPTAAQDIFERFDPGELGIEILKYGEVVYDRQRRIHAFSHECEEGNAIKFSGTKLRGYIQSREAPPDYLIRSEVYNHLINSHNSLVDDMYKKNNNNKGFVLWFTGLSAAGKSTIADAVYKELNVNGVKLERLDGDVVRENLTKGLGFRPRRPQREHSAHRLRGRPAIQERRRCHGLIHHSLPRNARRSKGKCPWLYRGFRGCAARALRTARSQGDVQEGQGGRDQAVYRRWRSL